MHLSFWLAVQHINHMPPELNKLPPNYKFLKIYEGHRALATVNYKREREKLEHALTFSTNKDSTKS